MNIKFDQIWFLINTLSGYFKQDNETAGFKNGGRGGEGLLISHELFAVWSSIVNLLLWACYSNLHFGCCQYLLVTATSR
jgi:hypothetical protein